MDRAEAKYFAGQPSAADIFGEDDPWAIEEATKTAARKAKAAARKSRPAKRNPRRRNPGKFTDIRDHKHYNLYIGTFTAKKRPTKADWAGTFLHRDEAEQAAAEILAELDPGFADVRIVEVKPRKK
jgi:hypothetical protein